MEWKEKKKSRAQEVKEDVGGGSDAMRLLQEDKRSGGCRDDVKEGSSGQWVYVYVGRGFRLEKLVLARGWWLVVGT